VSVVKKLQVMCRAEFVGGLEWRRGGAGLVGRRADGAAGGGAGDDLGDDDVDECAFGVASVLEDEVGDEALAMGAALKSAPRSKRWRRRCGGRGGGGAADADGVEPAASMRMFWFRG